MDNKSLKTDDHKDREVDFNKCAREVDKRRKPTTDKDVQKALEAIRSSTKD